MINKFIKIDDKGIDLRLLTMIFYFCILQMQNELENTLEKKRNTKEKKNDAKFEEFIKSGLEKHPSIALSTMKL